MKNNSFQDNQKISKIWDNSRNSGRRGGKRGGGGGGGGRSGGGGGGGGGHFGGSHDGSYRGFRKGQDGYNNNFRSTHQYPDDQVFNEFKGINDFNYAYEVKSKNEEPLQPKLPSLVSTAPPSFLELSTSKELQTKTKSETAPLQNITSSFEHAEPTRPECALKKVKIEKTQEIKSIKREKEDVPITEPKKVKAEEKKPPVADSSSSEDSSSEDSSSSEGEVPVMPKPMKAVVKPKQETEPEDEVICLGKRSDFENLVDDDDDDEENDGDKKQCLVCKSEEHSAEKCPTNCIKCSQSSYTTHVVCNNCGETYPPKVKSPNAPNPFLMFMQFMQFCMSQYTDISNEISQLAPGPLPVQGSTKEIEITRQDIADNKCHRKKSKPDSKQIRKKKKSEISSNSDSESSSKATTSVKKRKKPDSAQQKPPVVQPTQQSKQIRKKKISESSSDSDSDSSSKANVRVNKRKKADSAHTTPAVVKPAQPSKQIRKKKKSESTTDSSDSDSNSKANASVKKRKRTDSVQPTPPVVQPTQQSKQTRKKKKSESSTDSDSDSSSKATTSVKKRKKSDSVQATPQTQPSLSHFAGAFPNNVPFASGFSNSGYNPMLAFSQMMGYNPAAMNFPR